MEKMEGNGMRKLMVVGEKCHATWRVVLLQDECVGRHLRTSQITQDKTSNLCSKMSVLAAT